jgi:hypothetical protein
LSLISQREVRSFFDVDLEIYKASRVECLSSRSFYIRECKLWFLNASIEDLIYFFTDRRMVFPTWKGYPATHCPPGHVFQTDMLEIDRLIKESNPSLALLSPIEYVRESMKWYLANHKR